jgi:hypothetical protein
VFGSNFLHFRVFGSCFEEFRLVGISLFGAASEHPMMHHLDHLQRQSKLLVKCLDFSVFTSNLTV